MEKLSTEQRNELAMKRAQQTAAVMLTRELFSALLDEHAALREALRACVEARHAAPYSSRRVDDAIDEAAKLLSGTTEGRGA